MLQKMDVYVEDSVKGNSIYIYICFISTFQNSNKQNVCTSNNCCFHFNLIPEFLVAFIISTIQVAEKENMYTLQPSIIPFLNWPVQLLHSPINICHNLHSYVYNNGYVNAPEYQIVCTLHVLLYVTGFLHLFQHTRTWLCQWK
jgi:hypothetical protein